MMKQEIQIATQLIYSYAKRFGSLDSASLGNFTIMLENYLLERYENHWYPEKPIKGQAYRELDFTRANGFCDPSISKVCEQLHLNCSSLGFQHEFTIWVDPYEITIRLGSAVSAKSNEQFIVAKFDQNQNKIFEQSLDDILSQTRVPFGKTNRLSPVSVQEKVPKPSVSPSLFQNDPLFTPPRALSPSAAEFRSPSVNVSFPSFHQFETNFDMNDDSSSGDEYRYQPERSDTPHSTHSVTSNESSDSGYCGYVESFPYYYKLNRLQKALAFQKNASVKHNNGRHSSRPFVHRHNHQHQHQHQHQNRPVSPPTPTPANINQWVRFQQQSGYQQVPNIPIQHNNVSY